VTNQNPLKPVEHKDFMAQIAQFASLDVTQQLNQNILQLLSLQALSQSVQLVGRTVTAALDDGRQVTGKVTAVSVTPEGAVRMTLNTDAGVIPDVSIGQIRNVLP
jgi:flagellar basal-body rod modification protein FlgD